MIKQNQNKPFHPQNSPDATAEKMREYAIATIKIFFWGTVTLTVFAIALKFLTMIYLFVHNTITTSF